MPNIPQDPKPDLDSFKLYTGQAPWPLQIVAGLMWLGGLSLIVQGLPLLLLFGVGVIPMIIGVLTIKYARMIFKLQSHGYRGGMVIAALTLIAYLLAFFTSAITSTSVADRK